MDKPLRETLWFVGYLLFVVVVGNVVYKRVSSRMPRNVVLQLPVTLVVVFVAWFVLLIILRSFR
jgi:hypothetical protein